MTKMRRALLFLVGLGVLLFAGLSGGFWSVVLLVGGVGMFAVIHRQPRLAQAIVTRRWFIVAAGAALIVLSFGLIFANLPPLSVAGHSINLTDVVVGGHTVGIMLIVLPFVVRSMGGTRVWPNASKNPSLLPSRSFDGVREGMRALRHVVEQPGQFVRLATPWIVAETAISLLLIVVTAHLPKGHQPGYASILAVLLLIFAATLSSLTLYAVLWHRLALRTEIPAFGLWPSVGVWWSYAWRCWVSCYVLNTTEKQWMTWGLTHTSALHVGAVKVVLGASFGLLAFILASTYALVLPRVAAGRGQQMGFAPIAARRLGWRFTAGFAIAASPYLVSLFIPAGHGFKAMLSPFSLGLMFVAFLLGLFGIASGATYLSWAYRAVEGKTVESFA